MRTGVKTSEFWLSMAAMLVQLLGGFGVLDSAAMGPSAGVAAGYAVARAVAKRPGK